MTATDSIPVTRPTALAMIMLGGIGLAAAGVLTIEGFELHCQVVGIAWSGMIYRMSSMYKGFRFPREVISHCVWLYHRFPLSYREIEVMMAERGVDVTYETIRTWCTRFGPEYARRLRRRASRPGDRWHLDEVFVTIGGARKYLWQAVDQHGNGHCQVVEIA